jgi:hypothetical protein
MDLSNEIKKLQERVSELEKVEKGTNKKIKEKKTRKPTVFQLYMKENIPKVKADNPTLTHKEAFSEAARLYTENKKK